MPKSRRKLSAVARDFLVELNRLERFDAENQARFSTPAGPAKLARLSKHQLHFLTEAVFFKAYRAYEGFVRGLFLLYCLEKKPRSGARVESFLKPKGFLHAEKLIQSSMTFLNWTSPDKVISRAETYLKDGFPVMLPYTTHREALLDFKRIRNHLAHDSKESLEGYRKVLRKHYGTNPLTIPPPGEFLLVNNKKNPSKYKLLIFFDLLRKLAFELT